ncbi:MAG: sugar transferase [Acidimicrobiia bacterium]|nr:sugar transferase [Acidimicrobiia bacterium]
MRRRFLLSTAAADLGSLLVAFVVASLVTFDTLWPWDARLVPGNSMWPLLGFFVGSAVASSIFSVMTWAGSAPRPSYGRGLSVVLIGVSLTALAVVVSRVYWSRPFLGTTAVVWLLGTITHRAIRRRTPWTEQMVLVTAEKELVEHLRDAPHADVLNVLDPGRAGDLDPIPPEVTLVVDLRSVLSDRMAQYVSSCTISGTTTRALTNVYEEHTGRLPIVHLAEGWELREPAIKTAPYQVAKRIIDVVLVAVAAPLALVTTMALALLVRLSSSGPAIFKQCRIGLNGRRFTLYKLRTMRADAERAGPRFATLDDDRLVPAGKFLRKSRLDELPQLWNVLKGDLSLVGPRPEQESFVEQFNAEIPFYAQRHLIRPGVTGWAQVKYGYADDEADTIEKLTYDLYYVKNMSIWLDLYILGESIWTVLSGNGAR